MDMLHAFFWSLEYDQIFPKNKNKNKKNGWRLWSVFVSVILRRNVTLNGVVSKWFGWKIELYWTDSSMNVTISKYGHLVKIWTLNKT